MRALCLDESVIGTTFYVMDFLAGRIFRDARLPGLEPAERAAIYDELNATLARLHQVDYAGDRAWRLRPPGQLFRPPDRPLDQAVPRRRDRAASRRWRA